MTPPNQSVRRAFRRGFTLIELIAVLAVLVLLAAALIPLLFNQLDDIARRNELSTLQAMGDGLQRYVMRTRTIPAATSLLTFVGDEIGVSAAEAQANARGVARVVLIDPGLHIGQYTEGSSVSGGLLPYTQANAASKTPLSPRLMIVSSVGAKLPATLTNGIAANSAFTNLWDNPPDTVPSLWTTWNGNGPDLKIQRINMSQWFYQVSLSYLGTIPGKYGIDTGIAQVPAGNPGILWVIKGSQLRLYSNSGGLQATEVVDMALSFIYDNGIWRDRLFTSYGARQMQGFDVQAALNTFLAAPENPDAQSGTTKAMVFASMQAYLDAFANWSAAGYPSGSLNSAVLNAQADMDQKTARLIHKL